jgi:hypothetical protein
MLTLPQLVLVLLMLVCLGVAVYCKRSLHRERRGLEIHAHADGTVHEHHRGAVPHTHPTFLERYDTRVSRLFRETSGRGH